MLQETDALRISALLIKPDAPSSDFLKQMAQVKSVGSRWGLRQFSHECTVVPRIMYVQQATVHKLPSGPVICFYRHCIIASVQILSVQVWE